MIWAIIIILAILAIIWLISFINRQYFYGLFKQGNCIVTGMKGKGKDMAFCLVINHFKENYISNVQYSNPKKKYKRFEFDAKVWEMAGNTHENFINDKFKKFVYPYPDGINYYISDMGIYFPAQYATELVKKYKSAAFFQALSRHLGNCTVNGNVQSINRVWDKIREQSEIYIRQFKCKVFFGKFVFMSGAVYEDEETCRKGVTPPNYGIGKGARDRRILWESAHGKVKRYWFFAKIPYKYDDREFKHKLENGCIEYSEEVTESENKKR